MIFDLKTRHFWCLSLILFLFFVPQALVHAQGTWYFSFGGRVEETNDKGKDINLEGAIVTLIKGSSPVNSTTTGSNGKFSFKMDPEADYTVSFTKPGYITKKFAISTKNVPADRALHPFQEYSIEVVIFQMYPGLDYSVLNNPVAKIVYNPAKEMDDFDFDKAYVQSMASASAKLEELARQAREKEKLYAAAIAKADKSFDKKDYPVARAAYDEASKIKTAEQYPKDKIKECDRWIALANDGAKLDADYKAALAAGDAAMTTKAYDAARAGYQKAAGIKPAEQLPKDKLKALDDLLNQQKNQAAAQAKYDAAIARADASFKTQKWDDAKSGYTEALGLKPAEAYPKAQLKLIDDALAKAGNQAKLDADYKAAMDAGDAAMTAKTYDVAKASYQKASGLKPAEQLPKDKLKAIDDLLKQQQLLTANKAKYDAAIAKADKAFSGKDYSGAKTVYTEALSYKGDEQYPKDKIKECDSQIANAGAQAKLEADYKAAMDAGDAAMTAKTYDAAKTSYQKASGLKPAEQLPKDKLKAIDDLLNQQKNLAAAQAKYDAAIAKADAAFKGQKWEDSKSGYNEALGFKPAEAYPKAQLKLIDDAIAKAGNQAKLDADYKAAMDAGDAAMTAKTYDAAKASYTKASGLKPAEQLPKDKLKAIDDLLNQQKNLAAAQAKYDAAIAKGDAAFKGQKWDDAKSGYTEALGLKPAEAYPKAQLKLIDDAIAKAGNQAKLDADYKAAMDAGDAAMTAKTYDAAKTSYQKASGLKPAEQLPKDKLKALEDLLKQQQLLAANKAKYDAAIIKADKALGTKDYLNAKAGYNEALTYKADEQYPKDKLKEIDNAMAGDQAAKDKNAKYDKALAAADLAFKAKKFDEAKTNYNAALAVKPDEAYPKAQLKAIDDLANADLMNKAREEKYNAAIAKADAAFKTKKWDDAKAGYNEALGIKSTEAYPKTQLKAIEDAIAAAGNQAKNDADYKAAMDAGDASMTAKTYEAAKASYQKASGLKPNEQLPKDKLKAIDDLLNQQKNLAAAQAKYDAAIAKADKAFKAKDYTTAKAAYNEALTYKADEQYPKDKLKEIENALAGDQAAKDRNAKYDKAIAAADIAFKSKKYEEAKNNYNAALGIKPDEAYPKAQLKAIDDLANADLMNKARDEKYNAAIVKADAAFKIPKYEDARAAYTEALGIKPAEAYPKAQLKAIEEALANAGKHNKQEADYQAAIKKGDDAMAAKTFDVAKTAYTEASTLKPSEQYPKDKLKEIAGRAKYDAVIQKADKALASKDYPAAKAGYTEALTLRADEQYPKDKLKEIESLIQGANNHQQLNAKYSAAITKADIAFTAKKYGEAKSAYTEALGYKPEEEYPPARLKEIEELLLSQKNGNELNDKYNAIITRADKLFDAKDYEKSKLAYEEALTVKAAETYPKTRIDLIKSLLDKENKNKDANAKYAKFIQDGDKAMTAQDYLVARTAFTGATVLKPNEMYPKDKLNEITLALSAKASRDEKEAKYKAAVDKGNASFGTKEYVTARTFYTSGLTYKPADKYCIGKISEIDNILSDQKGAAQREKKYADAIARGDKSFALKDYSKAKSAYQEALVQKPAAPYPTKKIADCDDKLGIVPVVVVKVAQVDEINPLVKQYGEGIFILAETDDGNSKTLKIVVVHGTQGWIYRQVTYNWGGVSYFRNDVPIPKPMFDAETSK
jgi:tetratricopeptide (TPR) repeat protein